MKNYEITNFMHEKIIEIILKYPLPGHTQKGNKRKIIFKLFLLIAIKYL